MTSLNLELSSALASDIGWTLVHFLWQGLALAALLEAVLPLCRNAGTRHNWALAILAAMVTAPIVTFLVLHHQGAGDMAPVTMSAAPAALPLGGGAGFAAAPLPWTGWLVACWLTGVALLSLRALGGLVVARGLRRGGTKPPADLLSRWIALQTRLKLTWPVRFLQSHAVSAPLVVGWLRPVVLIPIAAIASLPPQQLDALIVHELAHIRRLDAFANLFLIMAETVLFYHPAIWWVSRRVRIEREHCCDDIAVAQSGDAGAYAEALTALEVGRMPALALSARGGQLQARVARLLGVPQMRRNPAPAAALVATALIAAAIVLPALAQPKPKADAGLDLTLTRITDDKDIPVTVDADKVVSVPGGTSMDFSGNVALKVGDAKIRADKGQAERKDGKIFHVTVDGNVVLTADAKTFRGDHMVIDVQDHTINIKMSPLLPPSDTKQGAISPLAPIKIADNTLAPQPSQPPREPQSGSAYPRDNGRFVAVSVVTRQGALRIQADMEKLAANGLTLEALRGALANYTGLENINQAAEIVLAYKNGGPVRMADIGTLAYTGPLNREQEARLRTEIRQAQERVMNEALAHAQADDQLRAKLAQSRPGTDQESIWVNSGSPLGAIVELTVKSDGAVLWNGTAVDSATLNANLKQAMAQQMPPAFFLRAEPGVSAERLQSVVGAAIGLGVTHISIEKVTGNQRVEGALH